VNRDTNRSRAYRSKGRREQGYVLLTLLLLISLLVIGAAVAAPTLAFQIRRDREEELVHRGVQYTRAIRAYAKRTGRYPVRTEELLGGPDVRFIRKLYKDPITKGDFKLLHLGDVQPQAANLNSSANSSLSSSATQASADGAGTDQTTSPTASDAVPDSAQQNPGNPTNARAGAIGRAAFPNSSNAENNGNQPGMLIFGVASKSKARSIREFDHKDHYNDWMFYYDPSVDRGYEIKGPTSRAALAFPVPGRLPGQNQPGGLSQQQPQAAAQPAPQSQQ
jgi:type II secretory pathway pseudopilin PulG